MITVLTYLASLVAAFFLTPFMEAKKGIGIILLTLLFASTFAGFVVPILVDEGLHETVVGKILSAIANISEALSILFLTVLMIATDIDPKYGYHLDDRAHPHPLPDFPEACHRQANLKIAEESTIWRRR